MFEQLGEALSISYIVTVGSMTLFFIGLFGLLSQKHFIKIFMSIAIMESSIFIFLLGNVFKKTFTAPILGDNYSNFTQMNDPLPQAIVLTAIVIGMAVFALGVSFAIEYYKLTNNSSIDKMNSLRH